MIRGVGEEKKGTPVFRCPC